MIQIRNLIAEDDANFWKLRLTSLQNDPVAFLATYEDFASLAEDELNTIYIERYLTPVDTKRIVGAFDGDDLIGMMCLSRENSVKTMHKAELWGVYVKEAYRGQGVAQQLMKAVLDEAESMDGLLQIQLSVAQVNQKAIRFYQSFGFESFAVIPRVVFWNGVFYDDEEMIKYLDN